MQKQFTSVGIDYVPFFTERTCESIQFAVRRFCNGHTEFRYEEPYIQQKVYLAIHRAVSAGRYHPEIVCRNGTLTSPQTFAKGIMRTRMAHMQCDLLEERWSARPTSMSARRDSDGADFVGKIGRRSRLTRSAMEVDTVDSDRAGFASKKAGFWPAMSAGSAVANGLCDSAMEADTVSDPHPTPFEALDDQERQDKIDTAVASMAPDVRAAWNGLAHDGISWSELGRREGISDNGARKRYKPKFLDAFLAVGLDEYYGGAGTPWRYNRQ